MRRFRITRGPGTAPNKGPQNFALRCGIFAIPAQSVRVVRDPSPPPSGFFPREDRSPGPSSPVVSAGGRGSSLRINVARSLLSFQNKAVGGSAHRPVRKRAAALGRGSIERPHPVPVFERSSAFLGELTRSLLDPNPEGSPGRTRPRRPLWTPKRVLDTPDDLRDRADASALFRKYARIPHRCIPSCGVAPRSNILDILTRGAGRAHRRLCA